MIYEVQQTRWDRMLRRVAGSIGPGSRVAETLSELFPVLDVENVPGELLLLGGTKLAFGGGAIGPVAGEAPSAQLFNPANSGHLVIVTTVYMASAGANVALWGVGAVQRGAVISTQIFRDTRSLPPSLPVAQISQETDVATAAATNQTRVLGNTNLKIEDPNGIAVLAPGTGLEIGFQSVLTSLAYSFHWRERPAEQSELSL